MNIFLSLSVYTFLSFFLSLSLFLIVSLFFLKKQNTKNKCSAHQVMKVNCFTSLSNPVSTCYCAMWFMPRFSYNCSFVTLRDTDPRSLWIPPPRSNRNQSVESFSGREGSTTAISLLYPDPANQRLWSRAFHKSAHIKEITLCLCSLPLRGTLGIKIGDGGFTLIGAL